MPKNSTIAKCVVKVMKTGKNKPAAIRICQATTGQSYQTGKKAKSK